MWKIEPRYWPELPGKSEISKNSLKTEKQPSGAPQPEALTTDKKPNPQSHTGKTRKPRGGAPGARKGQV